MTQHRFWSSAGMHLLHRDANGWLTVTPAFLRAYYLRPELLPTASSCAAEAALHAQLLADPLRAVADAEIAAIADQAAADNYRHVLAYRERLLNAGTIESAYLTLMRQAAVDIPPLFIDHMVHLIVHNMLEACSDPMRLRAAELLFREQRVSTDDGRLLLADQESIETHALRARDGPPDGGERAPGLAVLDVLSADNAHTYWTRSDKFDTAIDFRFGTPAPDAFARVIEAWLGHLLQLAVEVEPRPSISDANWRWHIGLDRQATAILDALYAGTALAGEDRERIVALFRMRLRDQRAVFASVQGKPIYLALAMDARKRVKTKPQNLLVNLPVHADA
jgi:hypothetical protein